MNGIKELALIFCAASVLSGGLRLLGGGALQKSAGYILSLIMLTSVVIAIGRTDIDFNISVEQSSASATDAEESMSEYQAEYICKRLLDEKGIIYEKITADATKTDDGGIVINEITIKGADKGEEAVNTVVASGLTETVILE